MKIAVASGKGGTGKTTIATSLARSLAVNTGLHPIFSGPPFFLDCDVEAPNAHLFLKPDLLERREVAILIPRVDEDLCTYCGKCAQVCQYHAIAILGKKTLVFPQLCHGCGSCTLVCPEKAISEIRNVLGSLEHGVTIDGIQYWRGILNVGEPMAVPVIRQLKNWVEPGPGQILILDAPPGTSCPVVETIRGSDFLLLVTEPTPFGLHDLRLAAEVAQELRIQAGVIVNRDGIVPFTPLDEFCRAEGLPILMRIPFERAIAEGIAQGKTLVDTHPETISLFKELFVQIVDQAEISARPHAQ
jgi:MinD superfamily P-loop ATPase